MDDSRLTSLGKYELRGVLGCGGMGGTVYEGWDLAITRKVAIKALPLPPNTEDVQDKLARFRREAQAAGRLDHPCIVHVYDYGETADLAYIVMEFVDGRTLKSVLDAQERLALPDIVRVMQDVLAGLQYSHERGVVHRDIKPANIILANTGCAKIADFGIARIESSSLTQAGTMLGTPAYMSPEQFMGQVVTPHTDIYSAGVVLYQLLTGEYPFDGGFAAIMHKALNTRPLKVSELSVTAPPALDAVVERAMARRPEDRYASAAAFSQALRAAAPRQSASAALAPVAAAPPARSSWLPAAIAAGIALLAVIAGGGWFALSRDGSRDQGASAPRSVVTAQQTAPPAGSAAPQTPAHPQVAPQVAAIAPASSAAQSPPAPSVAPVVQPAPATTVSQPDQAQAAAAQPDMPRTPPLAPAPLQQLAAPASLAVLRSAIAAAAAGLPCALISGNVVEPGGTVVVDGLAGQGTPQMRLHEAVTDAARGAPVEWRLASFENPLFCRALNAILPTAASRFGAPPSFSVNLDHSDTHLRDGDPIIVRVTMPDFEAQLQVDYLQSNGTVVHMKPTAAYPARAYPPRAHVSVGEPVPNFTSPKVGEPYGTDMILAIASTRPLFAQKRPEMEAAESYLKDIIAAIEAAQRRRERVTASALVLDTVPRR